MNNCLKTQLKGVVNNPLLGKLGEFHFQVNDINSNISAVYVKAPAGTPITARLVGTSHFTNSSGSEDKGTEISGTAGLTMYFAPGKADVFVSCRYSFVDFQIDWDFRTNGGRISIDINELTHSENGISLRFGAYREPIAVFGDITNIDAIINDFECKYNNTLVGSLNKIISNSHPENASSSGVSGNGILNFADSVLSFDLKYLEGKAFANVTFSDYSYGDLKYLADTNATNINITEVAAPNITGTIENFVARAIANGKTTGTMKFNYCSPKKFTQVTFGGTALSSNSNVPTPAGSQQVSFTWDAQGNVTWSVS